MMNRKRSDWIYCHDCEMFVDFWKYDYSLEDAGHADCVQISFPTPEEYEELKTECQENGCEEE